MGTLLVVAALFTSLATTNAGVIAKRGLQDNTQAQSSVGEITQAIAVPYSSTTTSNHHQYEVQELNTDLRVPSHQEQQTYYGQNIDTPAYHDAPTTHFEDGTNLLTSTLHSNVGQSYASSFDYSHSNGGEYIGHYVPSWLGGLDGGTHSHHVEAPHIIWESELEGTYVPSWLGGLHGASHSVDIDNTILDDNISEDSYTAGIQKSHGDSGYGFGTGFHG